MNKIILISLLLLLIFSFNVYALGLSVTPLSIKVGGLSRDVQFNTTITVYNTDTQENTFFLNSTGDVADWITLYSFGDNSIQTGQLTIPGQEYGKFIVNIKIPKDIPNGNYSSKIYVGTGTYNMSEDNRSSLSMRIPIDVSLSVVGKQIVAGEVLEITTSDVELYQLLNILVDFQNTGNLVSSPEVWVTIKKGEESIADISHNQTSFFSGERKKIKIEWDTAFQDVGDFTANVKVYLDKTLLDEENLNFKILERDSVSQVENIDTSDDILSETHSEETSLTSSPATGFFVFNTLNLSVIAFVVFAFALIIIGLIRSR